MSDQIIWPVYPIQFILYILYRFILYDLQDNNYTKPDILSPVYRLDNLL